MNIIEKLKEERATRDLSQVDFAKLIGVSQGMINKWELGNAIPNDSSIVKIASGLNWSNEERTKYLRMNIRRLGAPRIMEDALIKGVSVGMSQSQLAHYLGVDRKTFSNWKTVNLSKKGKQSLEMFLKKPKEEIKHCGRLIKQGVVMRQKKQKINRGVIDYELLTKIEKKYPDLDTSEHWPADDEDVIEFKAKLNGEI